MKQFLSHLKHPSYKQMFVCLSVAFCSLGILIFSFVSCDPPISIRYPSSTEDGDRDRDEDDDYDECRGFEACEDVCELIYNESWQECSEEDSDEVNDLQRVHSRLKASSLSRAKLIEVSEEEGDVELNAFEKYLKIGVDGWLKQIDGYDTKEGNAVAGYDVDKAQEVISWLAEEEHVAKILAKVDGGSRVLEALLYKANSSSSCFWESGHSTHASYSSRRIDFRSNSSDKEIEISGNGVDIDIEIEDSGHFELYDLLSCYNAGGSDTDIFSLAADEDNRYLFDLAFDLLDDVCQDSHLRTGEEESEEICRRVMMCVVAIEREGSNNGDDIEDWDGWGTGSNSYGAKDRFRESGFKDSEACDISSTEFGGNIDID